MTTKKVLGRKFLAKIVFPEVFGQILPNCWCCMVNVGYTPMVLGAMLNEDHLRAAFHMRKRRSLSLPGLNGTIPYAHFYMALWVGWFWLYKQRFEICLNDQSNQRMALLKSPVPLQALLLLEACNCDTYSWHHPNLSLPSPQRGRCWDTHHRSMVPCSMKIIWELGFICARDAH